MKNVLKIKLIFQTQALISAKKKALNESPVLRIHLPLTKNSKLTENSKIDLKFTFTLNSKFIDILNSKIASKNSKNEKMSFFVINR